MSIIFMMFYRFLISPTALLASWLCKGFYPKLRAGIEMRRSLQGHSPWKRLPKELKPIWIHCASGEFEYAKPVIRRLKTHWPAIPVLVTYFSPSYKKVIEDFPGVDHSSPTPWETPGSVSDFLSQVQPRALLITRTDLWPELLYQTKERNIPALVYSAPKAAPLWTEQLFKPAAAWLWGLVDNIQCVGELDKDNFLALGKKLPVEVSGDTRYDQVFYRLDENKAIREELFQESGVPTLILGSSWPEDENALLPALSEWVKTHRLRLIIAPHEPSDEHLKNLEGRLGQLDLETCRYSQAPSWQASQVLIVDQVGILAELYQEAQFAFVGGSFKSQVHSVMEPLATGCLCFVGPQHGTNPEAIKYKEVRLSKGLHFVNVIHSGDALIKHLETLEASGTKAWRERISEELKKNQGASEKSHQLVTIQA